MADWSLCCGVSWMRAATAQVWAGEHWGGSNNIGLLKDHIGLPELSVIVCMALGGVQSEPWSSHPSYCFVRYYNWTTAAPLLLAMQAFQKPLPKVSFDVRKKKTTKNEGRVNWGSGILPLTLETTQLISWHSLEVHECTGIFHLPLQCQTHSSSVYQGKTLQSWLRKPMIHS